MTAADTRHRSARKMQAFGKRLVQGLALLPRGPHQSIHVRMVDEAGGAQSSP